MWRSRQTLSHDVLRIGRAAVERWQAAPGGLSRVASQALAFDAPDRFAQLLPAIEAVFGQGGEAPVTVVLESAWVPVMLAETGKSVWRAPQVEALLRHRLTLLHDEPLDPVSEWDVRIDHRPGDSWALGYGFSPRLREVLAEATRLTGRQWAALSPGYAWGWQRLQPQRRWAGKAGHWAWQEQDRMLLGSFQAGRLIALNAAAKPCDRSESLVQELMAHGVRSGLPAAEWPVVASTWRSVADLPAGSGHVVWQGLGAPHAAPSLAKVAA